MLVFIAKMLEPGAQHQQITVISWFYAQAARVDAGAFVTKQYLRAAESLGL